MKETPRKPESIDSYISGFPDDVQRLLQEVRETIRSAAPQATETISYQMPAFKLHGILVYFAAWKDHIGFYPTSSGIAAFGEELGEYKVTRGTIQLPFDKPLPHDLIRRIVAFRVEESVLKKQRAK